MAEKTEVIPHAFRQSLKRDDVLREAVAAPIGLGTYQDAVGLKRVFDCTPLPKELRVRRDIEAIAEVGAPSAAPAPTSRALE